MATFLYDRFSRFHRMGLPWDEIMDGEIHLLDAKYSNHAMKTQALRAAVYRAAKTRGLKVQTDTTDLPDGSMYVQAENSWSMDAYNWEDWAKAQRLIRTACTCANFGGKHSPACDITKVEKRLALIEEGLRICKNDLHAFMMLHTGRPLPGVIRCDHCGHLGAGNVDADPTFGQPEPAVEDPDPVTYESVVHELEPEEPESAV